MVTWFYMPPTVGAKARIREVQDHPKLHNMSEVNLGYLRPCFRKPKGKKIRDFLFFLFCQINVSRTA